MENTFKEEDVEKVTKFLNTVAAKGKFEMNTVEIIEYFKLLQYMQQSLIPKVKANILEVVAIHEAEEKEDK